MKREELLKIAKPILFNSEMVKAILEGRKTVTRRIVKLPKWIEKQEDGLYTLFADGTCYENKHFEDIATYLNKSCSPGNILYVRETWRCWRAHRYEANADIMYKAGGEGLRLEFAYGNTDSINRDDYDRFVHKWYSEKWYPSIHMPKEVARIFLKVKDVRVERLQDITEKQAEREGFVGDVEYCVGNTARGHFAELWDTTIDKKQTDIYGWKANPWVWVFEFERIEPDAEV